MWPALFSWSTNWVSEGKKIILASFIILTFQRILFRNPLLTATRLTSVKDKVANIQKSQLKFWVLQWRSSLGGWSHLSFWFRFSCKTDQILPPLIKDHLSILRQSWCPAALILSCASAWVMDSVPKPSIARMTSPGHRLAAAALLPGVIWKKSPHS